MELKMEKSNILIDNLKDRIELIFVGLCFLFLVTGLYIEWIVKSEWHHLIYYIALFFGGYFATKDAIKEMIKINFEIDFLMILAAVGSVMLGKHSEAVLLLFLFSLGHGLEHYAMEKAKRQIKDITDLTPKVANIKRGSEILKIEVEKLNVGDIVLVKAGEKIPVDGIVIGGESVVNQAPITGESIPVEKMSWDIEKNNGKNIEFSNVEDRYKVFSGTINGEGMLEVRVARLCEDSTLSRLIKMISETETKQSQTQKFTEKIEKYYVPIILSVVFILCFAFVVNGESPADSFYRAMRVLVAGSPCALAISTPSAVLSGIGRAARERVLIKGGKALEILGNIDTIAFDKTGTLTKGKPEIKGIKNYGISEEELVEKLYIIEGTSNHPIAKIVTKKCKEILEKKGLEMGQKIECVSQNISGKGLVATVDKEKIFVGNEKLMLENNVEIFENVRKDLDKMYENGYTVMLMGTEKSGVLGSVSLMDEVRREAKELLRKIKKNGIKNIAILSGDNKKVVENIGEILEIEEINGELLPEDKLNLIKKMKKAGKRVAMVGDGINDAPAMVESDVAVAMGMDGSGIAMETADIVLLQDNLANIDFALKIGRKANGIIRQNLVISLGMIAFLIPAAMVGLTEMGLTVFLHEGSTAVVVLNALRLLLVKK